MVQRHAEGELVHISIAATQLGLSEYQMKGLVEKGVLPATKIGRRTYLLQRAINEYLERLAS